jgi:sRNA-binding carbon storage regulator CsrA
MKEDLAEWMNNLYPHIDMDADNFMNRLETGEHLVQHANMVRQKCLDLLDLIAEGKTKQRPPTFEVPERELPCRFNVQPTTWFARDNVFNFILFCRRLGVMECIMFETEDLVCRKNEKHVILTLLEVARRGAKLGMLAPMLVQFEQEIDREIAREERQKRKEEKEEEKRRKDEDRKLAEVKRRRELEEAKEAAKEAAAAKMVAVFGFNNNGFIGGPNGHGGLHGANGLGFANGLGSGADCVFDSMQVEFDVDDDLNMADVEDGNDMDEDDLDRIDEDEDDEEEEEDEEDDTTCFGYDMPIGPLPQQVTNDLKSLDEMVSEFIPLKALRIFESLS